MAAEACFCRSCVPTDASVVCSRCGEEVRRGLRHGREDWWHREDVDHAAIHGHMMLVRDAERAERERHLVREDSNGEPYTVAEWEILKDQDVERRRRRLAALRGEDPDAPPPPLPAPEVAQHDVTADDFPPRSGIRQIANLLAKTEGWEIVRFTRTVGPYIGAKGEVLSTSECVVLVGRADVQVDGSIPVAVGSWRDGKFDYSHVGAAKDGHLTPRRVSSTEMKDWIKHRDLPDPLPGPGE